MGCSTCEAKGATEVSAKADEIDVDVDDDVDLDQLLKDGKYSVAADETNLSECEAKVLAIDRGYRPPPTKWGRLSDWNCGVLCKKCYFGGHLLGTVFLSLVVYLFVRSLLDPLPALVIGGIAVVAQAGMVEYYGYHRLGGPLFSWAMSRASGVLARVRSDEEKVTDTSSPDPKPVSDDDEDTSSPDTTDPKSVSDGDTSPSADDEKRSLKRRISQLEANLQQQQGQTQELRQEKQQLEQRLEERREAEAQAEEEKQEHIEDKRDVMAQFQRLSEFHEFREKRSERLEVQQYDKYGNPYRVGYFAGFTYTEAYRYDEATGEFRPTGEEYKAMIVVWNRDDEVGQIPEYATRQYEENLDPDSPHKPGSGENEHIFDHLFPHPFRVDPSQAPEIEHAGELDTYFEYADHPGGDQRDYPRMLIQNNLNKIGRTRRKLGEMNETPKRTRLTLSYAEDGSYVPPAFDPRGFENRQELRAQMEEAQREARAARQQYGDLRRKKQNLELEKDRLEDRVDEWKDRVEEAKEEKLDLDDDLEELEAELTKAQKQMRQAQRDAEDWESRARELEDKLSEERQRSHRRGSDIQRQEVERAVEDTMNQKWVTFVETAKASGWEPSIYDFSDIGSEVQLNGHAEEITHEKVAIDFLTESDLMDETELRDLRDELEDEIGGAA